MDDLTLQVEDLRYRYRGQDRPAVDAMTFAVRRAEVFGFLGPSGAGKTTTQRILIGLLDGWSGAVAVLGKDRRAWGRELFDRIGVSFELPVGYPRLSGRQDLSHFANLQGGPGRDVDELLQTVGLAGAADMPVGSYSKGMRIRLNLARALLGSPDLLFLDEPTSGLDPVNAEMVRAVIREEQRRGVTVFMTTHDMATADAVCDRVAFVVDGRIAACDAPRSLRLAHGASRRLRVEHRTPTGVAVSEFPIGSCAPELIALLGSESVETVHTTEPTLDQVFAAVTGHPL